MKISETIRIKIKDEVYLKLLEKTRIMSPYLLYNNLYFNIQLLIKNYMKNDYDKK